MSPSPGRRPAPPSTRGSGIRAAGSTTTRRVPARSSVNRGSTQLEGVYVWIVGLLVLSTTALSLYDMYHLLMLMNGGAR